MTDYAKAERFNGSFLPVAENPLHKIYFEEYGNPDGDPVIYIHGGPGGGSSPADTEFFDPQYYRIILFDQRGAGKSTPAHCLENNTTQDSINDINKLKEHLGLDGKVHLFGGSWGSTLSLAYAIEHPDKVKSLMLRGIFLCREKDIGMFYQGNAADPSQLQTCPAAIAFPDAWKQYVEFIPPEERHDMLAAYHRRLNGEDKDVQLQAALRWSIWEGSTSKLEADPDFIKKFEGSEFAIAFARIETHYFMNGAFLGEAGSRDQNFIIENIHKIAEAGIPAEIVQGRFDMVCPQVQAQDLVEAWSAVASNDVKPTLHVVTAGHNAKEPAIFDALKAVTQRMQRLG